MSEPEEQRRQDALARREACREFARPLVVEAGAGTGKTATLVARILAWCLGPGWAEADGDAAKVLEGVCAITFTEAAADELSGRVAAGLSKVERGELPPGLADEDLAGIAEPDRRARARDLHAHLDRLTTSTIHAFCRRLIASHPMEARVDPAFVVDADGSQLELVVREVVEQGLRDRLDAETDEHWLTLLRLGVDPEQVREVLWILAAEGVEPPELRDRDPFAEETYDAFRRRFHESLLGFLESAGEAFRAMKAGSSTCIGLEGLTRLSDVLTREHPSARVALRELATEKEQPDFDKARKKVREWAKGNWLVGERNAVDDLPEEEVKVLDGVFDVVQRLDVDKLDAARHVLAELLENVYARLRASGVLTFQDLLTKATALVRDHPPVAAALRRRLRLLLVDEFQDTDETQCALVAGVALEGDGPRPSLFCVGDPKQSIYGWRSADLAAYEAFKEKAVARGGEVLSLSVNFRSAPPILAAVERAVRPVMERVPGLQPDFQPLLPCPAKLDAPGFVDARRRPVEHWVSLGWNEEHEVPDFDISQEESYEHEARALAADLHALARADIDWSEVAVLYRSGTALGEYTNALRRAGIPYEIQGDREFYQRREVIEAAALLRSVLDPDDRVALVTFLRSDVVGVPDAAWIPLFEADLPNVAATLWRPDPERLARVHELVHEVTRDLPDVPGIERIDGWRESLCYALTQLARLRAAWNEEAGDRFVELLRTTLMPEVTASSRFLGAYRSANLERLFRMVTEALERSRGDTQAVLRTLREYLAKERRAEEARPKDRSEDAVQLMTMHTAKGLDFEHVYLIQTHKKEGGFPGPVEVGRVGGVLEYQLFGATTLDFRGLAAAREEVEQAERVRLLYVAMTRAKSRLVLLGMPPKPPKKDKEPKVLDWRTAKQHSDLLSCREALPAGIDERMRDAAAHREDPAFTDGLGERYLFPAFVAPVSVRVEPEEAGLPGADELVALARKNAKRRLDAAERQQSSRTAAASAREHALEQREERSGSARREWRDLERSEAQAVGTAVHAVLEHLDLDGDPRAALQAERGRLAEVLSGVVDAARLDHVVKAADEILERLQAGPLLERLASLRDAIVARELPVLLAAGEEDDALEAVVGAVDLLYRDPAEDGRLVVCDYKTDPARDAASARELARGYAPQGRAYAQAVREALGLDHEPRVEFWFLSAGCVETVEAGA